MYSRVATATIRGIQSVPVCVEADVSDGMPVFEMVGFLASEVKEARERVRTALRNVGCALPPRRITANPEPGLICRLQWRCWLRWEGFRMRYWMMC